MRKITLLITLLTLVFGWKSYSQCPPGYTTVYLNVYEANSGSVIATGEEWVNITTEEDGEGSIIWSQGDELGENSGTDGLSFPVAICIPEGQDLYINAYDKFDDGWYDYNGDDIYYELTDPSGTIIIANNSGATPAPAPVTAVVPDDGESDGSSANWQHPEDLESSEMFNFTPPTCPSPSNISSSVVGPTNATLNWNAGGTETEWEVIVQYATDPAPASDAVGTSTTNNSTYPVTGLDQGTEYAVYVKAICDDGGSYWASNYTFTTTISCPDISNVNTTSIQGESVVIEWTAGGSETQWEVLVQTAGTGVSGSSTGTTTTNNNDYTENGLTAETDYEYYIRPICAANDIGAWSGPFNFSTPCSFTTLPYEYSFAGGESDCWEFESFGGNPWVVGSGTASDGDGGHLQFTYSSSVSDSWAYAKGIYLEAGEGFQLVFDYRGYSNWTPEKLKVTVGTSPSKDAQNTTLWDNPNILGNTYQESDEIIFTATEAGVYYIGFNCYSNAWSWYLYVDNIRVTVPPTCPKPKNFNVSDVQTTSAKLDWESGGASTWEVAYQLESDGNVVDDSVATILTVTDSDEINPYTLNGLDPNTTYNAFVRDYCAADDQSEWRGPVTFRTLCADYDIPFTETLDTDSNTTFCWDVINDGDFAGLSGNTSDFFEGNQSYSVTENYYSWSSPRNFDEWLISPLINITGDELVKFNYKITGNNENWGDNLKIEILISDTDNQDDFTTIHTVGVEDLVLGEYVEIEKDISAYNTPSYFAFRFSGTVEVTTSFFIDNIRWEQRPPCPKPAELVVESINIESVFLSWNPQNDNTDFQVVVQPAGTGLPTESTPMYDTTISTNFEADGLSGQTYYEVYVRNVCGGDDGNSEWFGPVIFSTLCGVGNVPWSEGFEGLPEVGYGVIPECMTLEGESVYSYNGAQPYYNQTPNTGEKFISIEYDSDAWLFTPMFNLDKDTNYKFSFSYIVDGNYINGTEGFNLKVKFGDGVNSESMEFPIGYPEYNLQLPVENEEVQNVYQTYEAVFSPLESGVFTIGINIDAAFDPYYMSIDDLKIEVTEEDVTNPINTVSVEDHFLEGLSLYPNPTEGVLNISSKNVVNSISVTNLLGQTIIEKEVNKYNDQIDITSLPTGNYIVKVQIKDQVGIYKILKN
ncbi:fibronectin type III domain-containing protein [Aureivirga marina]|uniref:fibronectin type III domain-containing protein n=1 Tax=Aureivirga marina TaxID=1182451 RepID=UPI0018CA5884|nr:fibronectin type III domain-containing protein [Aureivirga marina]